MAQVNAGRVRFIGRGEYDNSTQYYTFDLVNYNGNSYFAKSNTMGNLPTNSTYWQLVAEKGNIGPAGPTGNGIDHISLTSQSGATKVYTIYYTDGTTSEYTVQDGEVTQEVFYEEIERANMIYNAMPKVSGEGTDLTLNNTAKCPVYDIELSPSELEQETTSGKNLFSGYIKGKSLNPNTGAIINNSSGAINDYIEVDFSTNTDYYLSGLTDTLHSWIGAYNSNKEFLGRTTATAKTSIRLTSSSFTSGTPQGTGEIVYLVVTQYVLSGTSTGTIDDVDNLKTQLEIGTTATDFEEYTGGIASPNPQYPQEIHTVSGDNTVVVGNKNLFTGDYSQFDSQGGTGTTYDYFKLPTNEVYTLTLIAKNNFTPASNNYIGFSTSGGSGSPYVKWAISGGGSQITKGQKITINNTRGSSDNVQFVSMYGKGANILKTFTDNFYIQLEKGEETTYEEHKEQTYPLSLGDLEYCKIGDYEDLFFKNVVGSEYYDSTLELDKWYLKKNIGKVVLNGSETGWNNGGVDGNTYRTYLVDNNVSLNTTNAIIVWSNYFLKNTPSNIIDNLVLGISSRRGTSSHGIYIRVPSTIASTINDFKAWLSEHNPIVYYVLETPTNILLNDTLQTQLDNIQKAITYLDKTNVSQTNDDLPFVIKLSAIRDLSGIFEEI